jgi:hypothetical protein
MFIKSLMVYAGIATLFLTLTIVACRNPETPKARPASPILKTRAVYQKPPSSFNDTLRVEGKTAVFYNPDSLQIEKIRMIRDTMMFESDTHDCFYMMRNARLLMKKEWPKIKILETSNARFLLFINPGGRSRCIDLNQRGDMCGIFLFDGKKEPEAVDMSNIDTALNFYFSN